MTIKSRQKWLAKFILPTALLFISSNASAILFKADISGNFNNSTFMQYTFDAAGDRITDINGDFVLEAATNVVVSGNSVSWGDVSEVDINGNPVYEQSSFTFIGDSYDITNASVLNYDALNLDPFNPLDFPTRGYQGGEEIRLGSFQLTNGRTNYRSEIATAKLTIAVQTQRCDNDGTNCVNDRLFTYDALQNFGWDLTIDTTLNSGTAIENADSMCGTLVDPADPGVPLFDNCLNVLEKLAIDDPLTALDETLGIGTFDVTGVLGSIYLSGITPTNLGGFVEQIDPNGNTTIIYYVPEPTPLALLVLGVSLLGFRYHKNLNKA